VDRQVSAASTSFAARLCNLLLWVQGAYYLVTGLWPLVSIRTFKLVTGEKGKGDHYVTGLDADH
jgi:hypothetical protein